MALKSKLKIEGKGIAASFIFYAVAGIIFFIVLPLAFFPPHIGIIGILSLLTAYGLLKKRVWAVWLVVMLFFINTTFSLVTLYYFFLGDMLIEVGAAAYLILTWIFTAYIVAKRETIK
ncbi:MAG: hypothetical protein QW468_00825 [Candidatus Bathyarchaeia archaeon]